MAYFMAATMWVICFYLIAYLWGFQGAWGTIQWMMLFFTITFAISSVFIFRMGMVMARENKEQLKKDEAEQRRRARLHYEMTYEGIDVIPEDDNANVDDYNVYMNVSDGEVYFDEEGNEHLYISEEETNEE